MVKKVYGIDGDQYDALLDLQAGGCAVCGGKPKSKRLAVDHDHRTGAVRGLLCKRHNKDALGALHDSIALVTSLWHYLNTPPTSGDWLPIDAQPRLTPDEGGATRPSDALGGFEGIVTPGGDSLAGGVSAAPLTEGFAVLPVGSESVPGRPGIWRYFAEPDAGAPF